jgi:RNA polymerase sigma-70 factor, ECF subfamily
MTELSNIVDVPQAESLVERCKNGDRQAFCELFRVYGGMIQKIAYRITRDGEAAKDIFQDVVKSVIDNINAFKEKSAVSTWLFRITANKALNHLKRNRNFRSLDDADDKRELPQPEGRGQLETLAQREFYGFVMDAFGLLPEKEREILSLYYFAEWSVQEMADSTGRSQGTIKAILFQGRRKIVKQLRKRGVFNDYER